jgi:acetylornithine deacetylase
VIEEVCRKDAWLKEHPPKIEYFGIRMQPSETPRDHPLVTTFEKAYEDAMGQKTAVVGFPAGCDMRIRALHSDTPCLLFGPGDLQYAHRVDEHIDIEEMLRYVKVLALAILKWSV